MYHGARIKTVRVTQNLHQNHYAFLMPLRSHVLAHVQLVGPWPSEGVAASGFLFPFLSAACHHPVGGQKLGLTCDALGRARWTIRSCTWRLFSTLVRVEHCVVFLAGI